MKLQDVVRWLQLRLGIEGAPPALPPPAIVAPDPGPSVSAALTDANIRVTSAFSGAQIVLYGAVFDPETRPSDVVVIVRGPDNEVAEWRDELAKMYAPRRLVFAIPADASALPAAIADKKPLAETAAYVCRGMTCSAPVRSLSALIALTRS